MFIVRRGRVCGKGSSSATDSSTTVPPQLIEFIIESRKDLCICVRWLEFEGKCEAVMVGQKGRYLP